MVQILRHFMVWWRSLTNKNYREFMNRFEMPFGRKLLLASLIPLLVLSFALLTADFIALRNAQNALHKNTFDLANRLLSHIEPLTEQPIDQKKFMLIADILLSDTHIVGLSLSNDKNAVIFQAGIPVHTGSLVDSEQQNLHPQPQNDGNWITTIPNANQTWTLVLDDESNQLELYQNLLTHLIIFGISISILILSYLRIKKNFFGPIYTLSHYLLSLKLSPHHAIPSQTELSYLFNCAQQINELIESLNQSQLEMRNTFEAAINDFKESLESVEIQNIEMDLARKSAIQAERVKSEFLIHASSDLLEPLRQCLRAIQQLSRIPVEPEQADYTQNIETTLRGIIGLAQDIADFSRLENGKFQLEVKSVQIRQIAHDALTLYAPMAAASNSRILSIIQPEVSDILLGDPRRLQQVLGNLVNRVLNHGMHGNIAIKVSVMRSESSAQILKFSVIDCNGGFDDDFILQFKRLINGKNVESPSNKGSALGLSITRNLVEKMGGELGIELEPADQPCIWFTARFQIPENRLHTTPAIIPLKGCSILVIDEQPASRLEMTTLLHSLGAQYLEVTRMDDLGPHLPRWADFKPQIAIVDILNHANEFDKQKTLDTIALCNEKLGISCVVVASGPTASNLQKDLDPINARVINRPLLPGKLHQVLAHQLTITPILSAINSTPKIIPQIASKHNHRILVVDDTPSNTKLVAEFLKQLPIDVVTCANGADALSHCREKRFDLIFMDIQMPDADGFAVTAKIRELELGETRTPIVALTAQSAGENKTKYIVGGMDDYLSKPVNYEDLIQLIGKWIGKKFIPVETQPAKSTQAATQTSNEETEPAQQPVVILQECLKLAKDNPLLARDMLQMLIDDLAQNPADLSHLFTTHNWPQLQDYAHKLYGGACYCGVPALKQAAQMLDRSLQQGKLDNLETQINTLQFEIQRLVTWSNEYDLNALFELA